MFTCVEGLLLQYHSVFISKLMRNLLPYICVCIKLLNIKSRSTVLL